MPHVWLNVLTIVLGACIGLVVKKGMSDALTERLEITLGMLSLVIGMKMALGFVSIYIWLFSMLLGAALGAILRVQHWIEVGAAKLQHRILGAKPSTFAQGLTTTSILFCVGGLAIIGPIEAAMTGESEALITKSVLDGVVNISMGALYGLGAACSAIPVLIYQGSLALLAGQLEFLTRPENIADLTAVGGVSVVMIGFNLSRLAKFPLGDFLPSLAVAFVLCFFRGSLQAFFGSWL